ANDADGKPMLETRPDPATGSDEDPLRDYAVPIEWIKQTGSDLTSKRQKFQGDEPDAKEVANLQNLKAESRFVPVTVKTEKLSPEEQSSKNIGDFHTLTSLQALARGIDDEILDVNSQLPAAQNHRLAGVLATDMDKSLKKAKAAQNSAAKMLTDKDSVKRESMPVAMAAVEALNKEWADVDQ
ncbi:unnamed protein product, partial [Prorocentrum cordatum]